MSLNINTEKWQNVNDWVANASTTGDACTYPWSRMNWTGLYTQNHQTLNEDIDLSIAPWRINKKAGIVNLVSYYWFNNYYNSENTEVNISSDQNKAYKMKYDPILHENIPFILSYYGGTGTSVPPYWSTYWAFKSGSEELTTPHIGNRFPVANFRYDMIRVVPVVQITSDDPNNKTTNLGNITQYTGFPAMSAFAEKPYVCGVGFRIYLYKNNAWTEVPLTIDILTKFKGGPDLSSEGRQWFAGTKGFEMMRQPYWYNSAGTHYNNMIFRQTISNSMNSQYFRTGETNAFNYSYSRTSYDQTSDFGIGGIMGGMFEGVRVNEKNTSTGTIFTGMMYVHITDNDSRDAFINAVRREMAFIGLPFCDSATGIDSATADNGKLFFPIFDTQRCTTGDYATGAEAKELNNYDWQWIYDLPELPPDIEPTPGDDGDEGIKVKPSIPGFTLAGKGTECYALLEDDIDEIFDDIYSRDTKSWNKLIKGLQMFGSDPMGAIISFKWYPFTFTPGTSKAVYLGNTVVNPLHQYPIIESDGVTNSYVSNTASFRWDKERNFINSRHTKCRIYLPFYGFYELPISMMISKTLSVYMAYNVPDETAVWILSFDDVIYDFCECDPSIEIPLTGSNAGQIALVKRQAALSIAAQVAAIAGTAIVGATTGSGLAYLGYTASDSLVFNGALGPAIAEDVTNTLYGMAGRAGVGAGLSGLSGVGNIYNTVQNTKLQIGNLQTNLPHHGAASATTFLNLPMFPYIQFIQNVKMAGYDEGEYKLKVGHACDVWTTMTNMPENSLLQTTGMADMSSMSMELNEITELNNILQTGFYR